MEKDRSSNRDQGKGLFSFMPRLLLCMVILPAFLGPALADDSPGLDQLMGGRGRADHQKRIQKLGLENGNIYGWEEFSDPQEAKKLRGLLASKYANKPGNTFRGIPRLAKMPYGDPQ